ncbi:ABC transporter permease [Lentzea sp. PSKA42]|uniref:ABC transporter permease n=1 Tax=Lentzea indica TaxID=2604800 RepID=A0ABX1FPV8_9PSEU|nr:ABC transporter permease [Lentzea indica]NKE61043.1 ABC transporter permease [Lentzea indica]
MLRFLLRRDRVVLSAWVVLIAGVVLSVTGQYSRMFPTPDAALAFARDVAGNAALTAFTGQLTEPTLPGLIMWKIADVAFTLTALMAVLTVVRHTRAEEESGRQELLRSTPVSRLAPLATALGLAMGASLLVGALVAAIGGVRFGAAVAAPGLVFAAVAGVAAQLTERSSTARLIACGVLGVTYGVRFAADGSGVLWLRWFSPNGWSHLALVSGWVLVVPLVAAAALTALAFRLNLRRDFGAGVVPARPGSAGGDVSLPWRMHRTQLIGWTVAFALAGATMGGVAAGMRGTIDGAAPVMREFLRRYGSGEIGDTLLWMVLISLGGTAALFPVLTVLRIRSDETSGRAELLLSTAVGRMRWAAGHVAVAVTGTVAMMTAAGLAAGRGDLRVLTAAWLQVPPALTVGAVAMLAVGFLPRAAAAISFVMWLAVNMFGEIVGPSLGIGYDVANLVSPFHFLPRVLTGEQLTAAPLLGLAAVAVLLTSVGMARLRVRDLG